MGVVFREKKNTTTDIEKKGSRAGNEVPRKHQLYLAPNTETGAMIEKKKFTRESRVSRNQC